jgi:hypothetical protein
VRGLDEPGISLYQLSDVAKVAINYPGKRKRNPNIAHTNMIQKKNSPYFYTLGYLIGTYYKNLVNLSLFFPPLKNPLYRLKSYFL